MKKRLLGLALLVAISAIPLIPVQAGYSEIVIDTESSKSSLDEALWNNVDGDVTAGEGVITIPNESSADTRIISRDMAMINPQIDRLFEADFTIDFTTLPEGEKFVFAMGLQSIAANLAQRGNIEVAFSDNGGKKVAVSAFAEDDKEEKLLEETFVSGNVMKVQVALSTSNELTLSVNGTQLYQGEVPVSGEGSIGFLQTGSCGAKIQDYKFTTFKYDAPENPNFEEDFETGYFNSNVLLSKLLGETQYPNCSMGIEDYNGSKVLMFRNVGFGYIATKYAYSNFELTFDVPYIQKENVYNEAGEIVIPNSRELSITFGTEGYVHDSMDDYATAPEMIGIGSALGGYTFRDRVHHATGLSSEYEKKPFSVRMSVIDMQLRCDIKPEGHEEYINFVDRKLENTPNGNIVIWAPSGASTTFAIDNIKVVNMDKDANLIDVEHKSSKINVPEDFVYEPLEMVYNPNATEEAGQNSFATYLPVVITAACCVAVWGFAFVIRGKKRKGEKKDEA